MLSRNQTWVIYKHQWPKSPQPNSYNFAIWSAVKCHFRLYRQKLCLGPTEIISPKHGSVSMELLGHQTKTYYIIQIHDVEKKLIPVTNRIYWYPSVHEIKTREFGIPDNWSATAYISVSQEKWRGVVGGKVRTELMHNSHCSLNCCSVKNKLHYVKGNWKTHHRKLFCAFDTHSFPTCKMYAKWVLFSPFQFFLWFSE